MLSLKKHSVVALLAIATCGVVPLTGQPTAAGPYTAAQATAGRATYQASCASCHGAALGGLNSAAA
jgi:mono/diheme cytochrome c family protein